MTLEQAMSRREREVMEIIYRHGRATAVEVRDGMAQAPTDAAVRATLRSLVEKKHLKIERDGPRYVYHPTLARERARRSALRHLVETFFGGSTRGAMAALLDEEAADLSPKERESLRDLIEIAAKEGR